MKESTKSKIEQLLIEFDPDYVEPNREMYVADELKAGNEVFFPEPNELFLDIDTPEAYEHFRLMIKLLQIQINGISFKEYESRSGLPHRHIVVSMPDDFIEVPYKRIALQAILGSDRTRELLSLRRIEAEDPFPSLFSRKPGTLPIEEEDDE